MRGSCLPHDAPVKILRSLAIAALLPACGGAPAGQPAVSLTELMGSGDTSGFERALEARTFHFPTDHGPHPGFQTEWWYVTGNLTREDDPGHALGFHLTLFRRGLPATEEHASGSGPDRSSTGSLATEELYLGHFALADGRTGAVHAHERTARGAGGLAGATLTDGDLRVWLEDWELVGVDGLGSGERPRLDLRAREGDDALELRLEAAYPVVLQGDDGLSSKGSSPGQASYYYAAPRCSATGHVELDGERLRVTGSAWLDREWSTSALGSDQVGWDWFALQLDDGTDLMLYQMRLRDGDVDPTSHGSVTDASGTHAKLDSEAYAIVETGTWKSARSGAVYPSGWHVTVAGRDLELEVEPLIRDQELPFAVVYWEGAVRVSGTRAGAPISGVGYVELTGYADEAAREADSSGTDRGGRAR